ncbi:MAG TPA: hypothetical protein VMR77_02720 [Patescibacteria group bacterium]|jgi:hypothetical protein|nr:hypothetical protein [Patescibacteria group bacterium]
MRGGIENQLHLSPDSVATTTTPPGHFSADSPFAESFRLEAHVASIGIYAYVAELGESSDPAYRAWEEVRNRRAEELVGKVFGSDGKRLPYTGFEGYFVGESPTRIVEIEENLGEHILRNIHLNFGAHDVSSGLREHDVLAALHGKTMAVKHVREIMEFFDCLFKETLSEARPITPPETYEHFRAGTYQRVESGQTFTEAVNSLTNVTIATPRETEAYDALARIGVFGHPGLRGMHKARLSAMRETEHEEPTVETSRFARLAFPVPAGLLDDDNPLSR